MAAPDHADVAARRLYRAVADGLSRDEVRAAIEACAPPGADADSSRRCIVVAVNRRRTRKDGTLGETPLHGSHRLKRGDLVGLLLEAGADTSSLYSKRRHDPLALCIAYGQTESLRALLRQGHDANRSVAHMQGDHINNDDNNFVYCSLVHLCIQPPTIGGARRPPQLDCLRVLVQEGRADPNAREHCGRTALFWLPYFQVPVQICDDALDLLVSLGADVNARDDWGRALIFDYARGGSLPSLLRLLGHCVANPNVRAQDGQTPLLCCSLERDGEVFMELLRRSSIATRRSIDEHGRSALDRLVSSFREPRKPWHAAAMAELLRSGVPSRPESARVLLPIAAFVMRSRRPTSRSSARDASCGTGEGTRRWCTWRCRCKRRAFTSGVSPSATRR
jgi:ankyrin repeat protein